MIPDSKPEEEVATWRRACGSGVWYIPTGSRAGLGADSGLYLCRVERPDADSRPAGSG
jgi:hypothetical protein